MKSALYVYILVILCILAAALAGGSDTARNYHPVLISRLAENKWTHIQVQGTVGLIKREADGDIHIRLDDTLGNFAVAEIIPGMLMDAPPLGACIYVRGISRTDRDHKWEEIHPVEAWTWCRGVK